MNEYNKGILDALNRIAGALEGIEESLKKEKKKKNQKEKKKELTNNGDSFISLGSQIGSTDLANIDKGEALKDVIHVLEQRKVRRVMIEKWLDLYQDPEWICQEIKKAEIWMVDNPRAPKSQFARFYSSWLSRGWEKHRKSLRSQPGQPQAAMDSSLDRYFDR